MADRDPKTGYFVPGNKAAKGHRNPLAASRIERLTKLQQWTSDADMEAIWRQLLTDAKGGDKVAVQIVLDRVLGKAVQPIGTEDGDGMPGITVILHEARNQTEATETQSQ